jgi:hypothetical protein
MIVELAERARLTPDEFRARLNDAQIGSSGHGFAWLSKARALADQIAKETGGVVAGQVVGIHASDDPKLVEAAQQDLTTRIRRAFNAIELVEGSSLQQINEIRSTPLTLWHERAALTDPSGSYLGMGFKICVAIPPDAHPRIHEIIDGLPSFVDGIQVWSEPWEHAPGVNNFRKGVRQMPFKYRATGSGAVIETQNPIVGWGQNTTEGAATPEYAKSYPADRWTGKHPEPVEPPRRYDDRTKAKYADSGAQYPFKAGKSAVPNVTAPRAKSPYDRGAPKGIPERNRFAQGRGKSG